MTESTGRLQRDDLSASRRRERLSAAARDTEARLAAAEELGRVGEQLLARVLETLGLLAAAAEAKRSEMGVTVEDFKAEAEAELAAIRSSLDCLDVDPAATVEEANELVPDEEEEANTSTSRHTATMTASLRLCADSRELDALLGLGEALDRIRLVRVEEATVTTTAAANVSPPAEDPDGRKCTTTIGSKRSHSSRAKLSSRSFLLRIIIAIALVLFGVTLVAMLLLPDIWTTLLLVIEDLLQVTTTSALGSIRTIEHGDDSQAPVT